MEREEKLREIKRINQEIYEIDESITRDNKVIFIAALVIALTCNKDFSNVANLDRFLEFVAPNDDGTDPKPVDQIVTIAKTEIDKLELSRKTHDAIFSSLDTICGANTKLNTKRTELKGFIKKFISDYYPSIKPDDLFFETLYMEIDKKADKSNAGIILTPVFIAQLMIDLAELDYKKDILADLCAGTGLFSLLGYSKMLFDMNNDRQNGSISRDEYDKYEAKLYKSIIANDIDAKMVTLCLANFLLKSLNTRLLFNEDCLSLRKSYFKIKDSLGNEIDIEPTKAVLNPPYEDKLKPLDIILKNIELVHQTGEHNKVVAIVPPQKFGQNKEVFSKILNISTLTIIVKTQDDLFKDSGKAQPASIFVFDTSHPHTSNDIIRYYNFTDTGYVYLKDSGLVDKNITYESKKAKLMEKINNAPTDAELNRMLNENNRAWTNFYDINMELETVAKIDPKRIGTSAEESDITLENITIKKALREKRELLDSVDNSFVDSDGTFEKYIIDILSED